MNPIKIETFTRFQFASNPTFAPDGQSIAFVVQYADLKDNNYKGDLYLYDCAKDRTVRLTTAGDAKSYVWTSRGTLLFPADRDKKAGREGAGAAGEAEADGSAGTGGQEEFSTSYYEISPRGGEAVKAFTVPLKGNGMYRVDEDRYLITATVELEKRAVG